MSRQAPQAERRSGQAASLLPGIQQSHHFTGHRIYLLLPRSERVAESTLQRILSSVVVNDPFSHTHAAPEDPAVMPDAEHQSRQPHYPEHLPMFPRSDAAARRHGPTRPGW